MTSVTHYILTGLLFSFPFFSSSSGIRVLPSFYMQYMSELQAGENRHKSEGERNSGLTDPNAKWRSFENKSDGIIAGKTAMQSGGNRARQCWLALFLSDAALRNLTERLYGRYRISDISISNYYTRSIVLRI